eukprot:scaffold1958_cov253-Pinguiococcus_pyrenoidosus.AAC.17
MQAATRSRKWHCGILGPPKRCAIPWLPSVTERPSCDASGVSRGAAEATLAGRDPFRYAVEGQCST